MSVTITAPKEPRSREVSQGQFGSWHPVQDSTGGTGFGEPLLPLEHSGSAQGTGGLAVEIPSAVPNEAVVLVPSIATSKSSLLAPAFAMTMRVLQDLYWLRLRAGPAYMSWVEVMARLEEF